MPVTFEFTLDTPTASQDAQDSIKCYESEDGASSWLEIDSADVSALPVSAGIVTYVCSPADSAKYHILSPVSAAGVEYPLSVQKIIPPASTNISLVTLYVNVVDMDGQKEAETEFSVRRIVGETLSTANGSIVVGEESVLTDSNGFASLSIVADIGKISVKVGNHETEVDTTGLGGSAVDLSGYF